MISPLTANCYPLLIGSLPMENHLEATELIMSYTPQFPIWPQLPIYRQEGMIQQYLQGFPGLSELDGKTYIKAAGEQFETEVLSFYEEYLMVTEGASPLESSRFVLSEQSARGFYTFLDVVAKNLQHVIAVKGQTTGPITFSTGLVDQDDRAIFYDDQLRDVAMKHLALKARWQTRKMAELGVQPIMFFDEPGLAGLGTSAFITLTGDDIVNSLGEVFEGVRAEGGVTGIHVCANTEWPVVFDSGVDIVSFDAYAYFDKLVLYGDNICKFFKKGGILASGIVPTNPEFIQGETVDGLVDRWFRQTRQLVMLGVAEDTVFRQSFITPSCGTGTLSLEEALTVLNMTRGVSEKIRKHYLG
jgi:hypothetical protein